MDVAEVFETTTILMNTTGAGQLIVFLEDLSGLVLAIKCLRWITATVATLGVMFNAVAFLCARELASDSSGTALMKNLSLIDSAVAFAVGILRAGSALMGRKLLNINNYACKAGIFLTSWIALWGT